MVKCKECKFWEEDKEYQGMGSCHNEEALSNLAFVCEFLIFSEDYGCIFGIKK